VLFIALRPKLTRAALGLACVPLLWIGSGYATFSYSALRFGHWLSSNDKPHLDSIYLLLLILTATCAIATIPAGVASLLVPWSLLHGSGDETSEKTKTRRLAIAALIASWALLFVLLGLDLGGAMSWLLELFRLR
jgi:hypothetical protein